MNNDYKFSNQVYIDKLLKHNEEYYNDALNFIKNSVNYDATI